MMYRQHRIKNGVIVFRNIHSVESNANILFLSRVLLEIKEKVSVRVKITSPGS